jgi:hypothetical protein
VFHYWADGDYAANGIAPERISEIDTRYGWVVAVIADALLVAPGAETVVRFLASAAGPGCPNLLREVSTRRRPERPA